MSHSLQDNVKRKAVALWESHDEDSPSLTSTSEGKPLYQVLHWLELRCAFSKGEDVRLLYMI